MYRLIRKSYMEFSLESGQGYYNQLIVFKKPYLFTEWTVDGFDLLTATWYCIQKGCKDKELVTMFETLYRRMALIMDLRIDFTKYNFSKEEEYLRLIEEIEGKLNVLKQRWEQKIDIAEIPFIELIDQEIYCGESGGAKCVSVTLEEEMFGKYKDCIIGLVLKEHGVFELDAARSLSHQVASVSKLSLSTDGEYRVFDGTGQGYCQEFACEFNRLLRVFLHLLNSASFREQELKVFDRLELEYQMEFSLGMLERAPMLIKNRLGQW